MRKIKPDTIIRAICLALALINLILTELGKPMLPFSDEEVTQVVTLTFTIGAAVWGYWKNNSFTQAALAGDELMEELKSK